MTTIQTEIYPNAPLAMVVFELRIPHTLSLATRPAQTHVWEALKGHVPITQPEPAVQVTLGATGMMQTQQGPLRMLDRRRTLSVVVGAEVVVVESTGYRCFEEFREFLASVLAALPCEQIAGFGRIGLRYINEIRIPGVTRPDEWSHFIAPALLAGTQLAPSGLTAQGGRTEAEYLGEDGMRVTMRYGSSSGRLVNAEGPMRTRTRETGPLFFIDLDSYWENPQDCDLPEFSGEAILAQTTRLREPIHELFETAINGRARDIFRKEPQ